MHVTFNLDTFISLLFYLTHYSNCVAQAARNVQLNYR